MGKWDLCKILVKNGQIRLITIRWLSETDVTDFIAYSIAQRQIITAQCQQNKIQTLQHDFQGSLLLATSFLWTVIFILDLSAPITKMICRRHSNIYLVQMKEKNTIHAIIVNIYFYNVLFTFFIGVFSLGKKGRRVIFIIMYLIYWKLSKISFPHASSFPLPPPLL